MKCQQLTDMWQGQGDHKGPEEASAHRKEEVLNGFEIFLVCVSVISVSVHSWFPLSMSPPDSGWEKDGANHRQSAAAWKPAHTVGGCFPSSGMESSKSSEGGKLVPRLQQKHFFVLFLMPRDTYLVSPLFLPSVPQRKAVWVSHAGDFHSSGDSPFHLWVSSDIHKDHWPGNWFPSPYSQAASGPVAQFPDRPHPFLQSVQANNMLCKSCHHSQGLHIFFSVP